MKISILCYNHFDATISLGKYLKEIEKGIDLHFIFLLSQSFLNIEVITLENQGVKNGFISQERLRDLVDKELLDYLGANITLEIFIFNSYKIADFKNLLLLHELKTAIRQRKYDLLHFVGNNPWIIFLNIYLARIPKVHTLHEPYPFTEENRYRLFRHQLKIQLLILTKSHILLPSKVSYLRFSKYFKVKPGQASVICFGPLEIFKMYDQMHEAKAANVILYYGYISQYKGIEVLIESWEQLIKSNPGIRLIIAGSGDFNYKTPPASTGFQLINKHLSNQEIAQLNRIATIIICPYTSASQSGVVMTSFAFNNPVIATNVGALPEFVEDGVTGIIIEPNNSQALCKVLTVLFNNPAEIEKLRNNIAEKYSTSSMSWSKIAGQTLQLYLAQIDAFTQRQSRFY